MISLSVGEILQGWDEDIIDARIYMVRDDKLVFFVGVLERSILEHMLEHCRLVDNGPPANGWAQASFKLDAGAPTRLTSCRSMKPPPKRSTWIITPTCPARAMHKAT